MRAAITTPRHELEVIDIDDPHVGEHQLLLRVEWAGICGSDLHLVEVVGPGVVLGHEFVGTVQSVGAGVEGFVIGDRACAVPALGCSQCLACLSGDPVHCAGGVRVVGNEARGAFAEYVVVSALQAVRVPDEVRTDVAALVEPLAIGVKVLGRARLQADERLLVIGAGPIGLAVVLWARQQGVGDILVSEPVASRRELALEMGATAATDPATETLVDASQRELGRLPEVVIECAGLPGLLDAAVQAVAPFGRLVVAGLHLKREEFYRFDALMKEITMEFPNFAVKQGFRHSLRLLSQNRVDPRPLVTHRIQLDALPEMFHALRTPNNFGKVLVSPSRPIPRDE
jgi:(R,R)-butanediol dehydrogenase/meso-butanediol dehydrogenase/diacetyl reductase